MHYDWPFPEHSAWGGRYSSWQMVMYRAFILQGWNYLIYLKYLLSDKHSIQSLTLLHNHQVELEWNEADMRWYNEADMRWYNMRQTWDDTTRGKHEMIQHVSSRHRLWYRIHSAQDMNSFATGRYGCILIWLIFRLISTMNILSINCKIGEYHNTSLMASKYWFR